MNDKLYNLLKYICITFIPALVTLTGVLGNLFHWSATDVIMTIEGAVGAFIGSLIGLSSADYYRKKEGDKNEDC